MANSSKNYRLLKQSKYAAILREHDLKAKREAKLTPNDPENLRRA